MFQVHLRLRQSCSGSDLLLAIQHTTATSTAAAEALFLHKQKHALRKKRLQMYSKSLSVNIFLHAF